MSSPAPLVAPTLEEDSPLMQAALAATRTLVNLQEGTSGTLTDEALIALLQDMIDNKIIDLFYGSVGFVFNLVGKGRLTPPVRAKPSSSGLILPAGYH